MDTPVADWVMCQTSTIGTGTVTLGAALSGYTDFQGGLQESSETYYSLLTSTGDREVGLGNFNYAANTLVRTTVQATLVNGVFNNTSPSPINLVGTSIVACTFNAESWKEFITLFTIGTVTTGAPGSSASANLTGTHSHPILNLTIPRGDEGDAATIAVGTVTTVLPGDPATVTNVGTSAAAVFDFNIPQGEGATVAIGTVTTVTSSTPASVTNVGTAEDAILDFDIPQGEAATIAVGTVTTVTSSTPASVTNVGTAEDAVLDFDIPQGEAATVAIGTVTTVSPTTPASVTNVGTAEDAVLDFGIPQGATGATGATGTAATIAVGTVTTVTSSTPASVTNSGTSAAAIFDFGIPQGEAATVAVGTVDTVPYGDPATVTNVGTAEDAILDFEIPGGPAATIAVGTVTSVPPGDPATVTNVGTSTAAIFDFDIPQGGSVGIPTGGVEGQILAKNSATDYDTIWIDNTTATVQTIVRNETGAQLNKGTVVYVTGASSNKALVSKAKADSEATSSKTFGILAEDIPHNQNGLCVTSGLIDNLNTNAYTNGTPIWLSATTAGEFTSTKPTQPNHAVFLGWVTYQHVNQGAIELNIQNGYELGELHNVLLANPPTGGDFLVYDSFLGLWVNETYFAQPNGVATLDSSGKLETTQLPDLAVSDYLGTVANQTAMLALSGQKGDWCTRSDLGTNWIITGSNPTLLASWTQLSYPTAPVVSVNGATGAVTLTYSSVGAAPATTGTSILKGNGSGGFSNAASGTDYAPATSGTSLLKGNGSGGFSNAASGTDYAPATSGTSLLKGNGSGGFNTTTATLTVKNRSGTNISVGITLS